jgi:hypothetical protein
MLPDNFPAEQVPDGAIFAPHHSYIGVMVVLFVCWLVADDFRDREPMYVAALTIWALFSFGMIWPYYPGIGAAFSLLCPLLAVGALLVRRGYWSDIEVVFQVLVLVGLLLALDDVVSHVLAVSTPVDYVFHDLFLKRL